MFSAPERGLANTGQQVFDVSAVVFRSQRQGDLRVTLAALGASRTDALSRSAVTSGCFFAPRQRSG
jgi:hypothetical protein